MRELVFVVSDLFISQETPERELPPGVSLPGLQYITRFASRTQVADWRVWLARWLARSDEGTESHQNASVGARKFASIGGPATVAAAALNSKLIATAGISNTSTVWIATPVHLITGLTSLHLDRRGILRLSPVEAAALVTDFQRVFHDSGFVLHALTSGDFLLFGHTPTGVQTLEPARLMGSSVAEAQRADRAADPTLRRLGAEIEMWLHDHAINAARQRRGEFPVSGLWFWGGGPMPSGRTTTAGEPPDLAFGNDACLEGLWALYNGHSLPLPQQLSEVFSYPHARRAVLVIEMSSLLNANPTWTFFEAMSHIDRTWLSPAVNALKQGDVNRLVMIANDRELALHRRDRLKFWRRVPSGLSGLQ